jgi:hypothetical protein
MVPMPPLPITESAETRLTEPPGSLEALAGGTSPSDVAGRYPACLTAWAALGEAAEADGRPVDAYAYYRTGYHRGLDRLRAAGWRGSGLVPWAHEPNRGFLRALGGLGRTAGTLGEADEATRCAEFFAKLAPDAPAG